MTPRATGTSTSVCVAGMHRSGTSMVTRLLQAAGMHLGEPADMMKPQPDNEEGYYENLRFFRINERILAALGGSWDKPPLWKAADVEAFRPDAEQLLREFSGHAFWGWKDPRNTLTLPFWKSLLPGLRIVACVRSPLEVAASLRTRDAHTYAFAMDLWRQYHQQLLANTRPEDRIVTHYDAYFHNPSAEIRRVLSLLGRPVPDDLVAQCLSQIKIPLRHHKTIPPPVQEWAMDADVVTLYRRLCDEAGWPLTQDRSRSDTESPFDTIAADITAIRPQLPPSTWPAVDRLLSDWVLAHCENTVLARSRDIARQTVLNLRSELARKETPRPSQPAPPNPAELAFRAKLETTIRDLEGRLAAQNTNAAQMAQTLALREDTIRRLEANLAARDREAAHRGQSLAAHEEALQHLKTELEAARKQLLDLQTYAALVPRARHVTQSLLPATARVLVVSKGDENLRAAAGPGAMHFPCGPTGDYLGYHPADSAAAMSLLKQAVRAGAEFFLLPQSAFWWRECYPEFVHHLEAHHTRVANDESCMIFDLRAAG